MVILWKQGWRLETNHDTKVSKVFKARYFQRGNFVDAKLGQTQVMYSVLSTLRRY